MAATLGNAILRVGANTAPFMKGMGQVGTKMQGLAAGAQKLGSAFSAIGRAAASMGAAILASLAPAIIMGSKFEQAMANVKSVMGDVSDGTAAAASKFADLNEKAKQLGATTQFTASEVAKAMEFMALAGFNAAQTLEGTASVLALAAAGSLELGRASDIATDTMTAFKLEAEDLGRVADVLAQTAANSNTTVELLGNSMKLTAPVAAALGQSIEDTSTALGVLANAGLKGTVSGAGLAQMLGQIVKKGDKVNEVLHKYGLSLEDIDPTMNSIRDIIEVFEDANLSAGDAMKLFGARAGRMALALKNQGVVAFDQLNAKIEAAAGSAERMAAIRMDTTIGDFKRMKSAIEGLGIEVFNAFKESMRETLTTVTRFVGRLIEWVKANKKTVGQIAKMMALVGTLAVGLGAAAIAVGTLMSAFSALSSVVSTVLGFLSGLNVLIVAAVAVWAAIYLPIILAVISHWKKLKDAIVNFWEKMIKPVLDAFMQKVRELWEKWVKPAFEKMKEAVGFLIDAYADMMVAMEPAVPFFKLLAKIVGTVLVGAFTLVMKIVTAVIGVFGLVVKTVAAITGGIAKAAAATVKWFGSWFKSSKKMEDQQKKLDQQRGKANKRIKEQTEAVKALTAKSRLASAQDRKALAIMKDLGKATILQLKTLEELQEKGAANVAMIKLRIVTIKKQLTQARIGIALGDKENREILGVRIKKLKEELKLEEKGLQQSTEFEKIHKGGLNALDAELSKLDEKIKMEAKRQKQLNDDIEMKAELKKDSKTERDELKASQEVMDGLITKQAVLRSQDRQRIKDLAAMGGSIKALRIEEERRRKVLKAMGEGEEILKATSSDMDKAVKELSASRLTGLAKERESIAATLKARQELFDEREKGLKLIKAGLELRKRMAESAKDSEVKTKRLAAVEKELADVEKDLTEIRESRTKATLAAADAEKKLHKTAAENRKQFLRDLEIEELKRQDQSVAAARLTNQKLLEEQKKANDKMFELTGDPAKDAKINADRARAEELQRIQASKRLADAFEKEDGKKNVVAGAKQEAAIEKGITGQLAKQVRSVRDMFMLYMAIAKVRQFQENRARAAADFTIKQEARLEKLTARRDAMLARGKGGHALGKLDFQIQRLEKQLELTKQIEGKRAGEAQLGDAAGNAAVIEAEAIKTKLDEVKRGIVTVRGDITALTGGMQKLFANAPESWITAFIKSWVAEAPRLLAAVQDTMHDVGAAMAPETRNSPSLIDIWNMNAKAAGAGAKAIQSAVNENMPNMGALNSSQAIARRPSGIGPGGFSGRQNMAAEQNDNRTVNMDIHSNVDVEDMKRQVGLALEPVGMGATGEM